MSRIARIREFLAKMKDLWDDRDVHIPAFKEGIKTLPERIRSADPKQRRILFVALGAVAVMQLIILIQGL